MNEEPKLAHLLPHGVPWELYWGLYAGSILFSIKTLDMLFLQKDVNVAAYTDDNSPYFCDKNPEVLLSKLQVCALKLFEWFSNICVKMNSDLCHLIFSSNDENKKIELNGGAINNTQIQKLLGGCPY